MKRKRIASGWLAQLRQFFCGHQWQPTKFQALVPGTSMECTKCGKQVRVYLGGKP